MIAEWLPAESHKIFMIFYSEAVPNIFFPDVKHLRLIWVDKRLHTTPVENSPAVAQQTHDAR